MPVFCWRLREHAAHRKSSPRRSAPWWVLIQKPLESCGRGARAMSVAITGWAWRTPLGSDPEQVLDRLVAGECAGRPHLRLASADFKVALGCAIPDAPRPSRQQRFLRRMGLLALECGMEARAMSGTESGTRLGVFLGYGGLRAYWNDMMPALEQQHEDGVACWSHGLRLLHPFWMLQHLSNNVQALLSMECAAKGEGITCGGANAGAQALAAAERALGEGSLDAALVVAHDTLLEPETLVELGARSRGAARTEVVAPYGTGGQGFLPGEAAAALVLERVAGGGDRALAHLHAADGADGSREEPSAKAMAAVTVRALAGARRPCAAVDGAARAWEALDAQERRMLSRFVANEVPLTATQAALGQMGAAASLVQAIALSVALRRGILPPIAHLVTPRDGPLRPLTRAEPIAARCALALATGAPGLVGAVCVEMP